MLVYSNSVGPSALQQNSPVNDSLVLCGLLAFFLWNAYINEVQFKETINLDPTNDFIFPSFTLLK